MPLTVEETIGIESGPELPHVVDEELSLEDGGVAGPRWLHRIGPHLPKRDGSADTAGPLTRFRTCGLSPGDPLPVRLQAVGYWLEEAGRAGAAVSSAGLSGRERLFSPGSCLFLSCGVRTPNLR